MEKIMFVYLTENLVNGKKYIGQHYGYDNDGYLGSGSVLKYAINKHGVDKFNRVILEILPNKESLDEAERKWIQKFNAANRSDFYNLTEGGTGGNTLSKLTEEEIMKRSEATYAYWDGLSDEERQKKAIKMSEAQKEIRKNETLEKQRIENFKKTVNAKSKEEKDKQYLKVRGARHYEAKAVKTPLGIFQTLSDAANAHKCCISTITNRCKHPNFTDWNYLDD